jgi:hypothetical protein
LFGRNNNITTQPGKDARSFIFSLRIDDMKKTVSLRKVIDSLHPQKILEYCRFEPI